MILADVPAPSPSQMGTWIFGLLAFIPVAAAVGAVISYFATRREVEKVEDRVKTVEEKLDEHIESITGELSQAESRLDDKAEVRAKEIHDRINPAAENIAEVKGQMQAFTASFENFSRIIIAIARKKDPET